MDVLGYINAHQSEVADRIDAAIRQLPFLADANPTETVRAYVLTVSGYGTKIPAAVREAVVELSVAITIFLLTAAYCVYGCRLDRQLCAEQSTPAL